MIERGATYIASEKGVLTSKPRPVLVLQNQRVNSFYPTITACLISATLTGRHEVRVPVSPSLLNGLKQFSEVQADRLFSFQRDSFDRHLGRLNERDMERVESAIRRWLGF